MSRVSDLDRKRVVSDPPAGRLMLGFVLLPPAAGLIMFVTAYMAWQMDVWFLMAVGASTPASP